MGKMEKTIEVCRLSKSFNGQNVVREISFDIKKGEVFGLIGPNGAGKTTIIRMLLEKMGMSSHKDKKISELSKGMQQIAGIFSLAGAFPMMFSQFIFSNPNEGLAIALSIFPLTAPIAMIMRLSITDVPLYELMISILVLAVSAYFIKEISARIFRASLLMYGKKPTIKELIKYVRQN